MDGNCLWLHLQFSNIFVFDIPEEIQQQLYNKFYSNT